VPVPAAAGVTGGTIGFPTSSGAPAGSAKLSITVQPDVPAGVPALSGSLGDAVARRSAPSASQRAIADAGVTTSTTTDIAAIIVTSTASLTFPTGPVVTLNLPASLISTGESFELAYFDPVLGAWNATWAGPATVTGSALTFPSNGAAFTLTANTPAVFELVATTAGGTASPSPSPTASATSTPPAPIQTAGPVALSTSSIALVIGGTPTTQDITVSQSGVAPTFTPTLTCTVGANSSPGTVATIAAVDSATAASAGAPVTFAVSVASSSPTAGTCTGSIASSAGGTAATFSVTVTQTNVSLDARARQ